MSNKRVLAHIVLHHSPQSVSLTIESLLSQDLKNLALEILITDNASNDDLIDTLEGTFHQQLRVIRNRENIGFAAAQNRGAAIVIEENYDYLFMVNPDSRFEPDALEHLIEICESDNSLAGATPLLYRADSSLTPLSPIQIDAAGMKMTRALRHFDRDDPTLANGKPEGEFVFGGTGAALLLRRQAIASLAIESALHDEALFSVYPCLREEKPIRIALFDEAFFAFREDADLAWRAQILGWSFKFVPRAIGYHIRHVLPERRSSLSKKINSWSVRNRFLMQVNNFSFSGLWPCVLPGLIGRNLLVVIGVILYEPSSLKGIVEFVRLLPRALARRRIIFARKGAATNHLGHWFE